MTVIRMMETAAHLFAGSSLDLPVLSPVKIVLSQIYAETGLLILENSVMMEETLMVMDVVQSA